MYNATTTQQTPPAFVSFFIRHFLVPSIVLDYPCSIVVHESYPKRLLENVAVIRKKGDRVALD